MNTVPAHLLYVWFFINVLWFSAKHPTLLTNLVLNIITYLVLYYFFSGNLLLVYRNVVLVLGYWFCILQLCWICWSNSLLMESRIFIDNIMLSAAERRFYSFSILMPFISFSWLSTQMRTSSTVIGVVRVGSPVLFLFLEKDCQPFLTEYVSSVFVIYGLYCAEVCSIYT